jgi:hypothetical protein
MPRRAKGLTSAQVDKGTKPGRFGDGAGLYLLERSREAKFWLFRYIPGLNDQHLKLSGPVLAGIYQGKINQWDDPAIAKINRA